MIPVNTDEFSSLKELFSISNDAVIGISNGIVVFSNPSADRLWGRKTEGQTTRELLPEHVALNTQGSFICSAKINHKPVSISVSHIAPLALVCVSELSGSDRPVIDFSRIMYSLNTHLHTMRTASDWLFDTVDFSDPRAGATASIMMKSYFTVLRSFNNITTLQQIANGTLPFEPVWTDLNELIKNLVNTLKLLFSKQNISFIYNNPEKACFASADEKLLEQLILNLVSNSIMNMKDGGTITLTLSSDESKIILSVEDDGPGIDETLLTEIFNSPIINAEFKNFKAGSGLGLFIARGIVELHGGVILIESRAGKGVSVGILLPCGSTPKKRFSASYEKYNSRGMDPIFRELSGVLNHESYKLQFSD